MARGCGPTVGGAARDALAEKFAQLQAKAEAQDAAEEDEERLVGQANGDALDAATIAKQLARIQRQMAALDAAMAESVFEKLLCDFPAEVIPQSGGNGTGVSQGARAWMPCIRRI